MGFEIETNTIEGGSDLAKKALSLTGDDMRVIGLVISLLEERFDVDKAEKTWNEMLEESASAVRKSMLDVSERCQGFNKRSAVMFLCAICLHAMSTAYANATELAFSATLAGDPIVPLDIILAKSATPPASGSARS